MFEDNDRRGDARSASVARVSHDMEGIFGSALRRAGERARQPDAVAPIVEARPERWHKWAIGAIGMALCGIVAVGASAWMSWPGDSAAPAAPPASLQPAPATAVEAPSVRPAARPASQVTLTAPAASNRPVVTRKTSVTHRPARRLRHKPVRRPIARKIRSAPETTGCHAMKNYAFARCMHPHIVAADRQLRTAYAAAIRAGIDGDTLRSSRNRWARLRTKTNSDPKEVAAGYQDIARRLDAARRRS